MGGQLGGVGQERPIAESAGDVSEGGSPAVIEQGAGQGEIGQGSEINPQPVDGNSRKSAPGEVPKGGATIAEIFGPSSGGSASQRRKPTSNVKI